jgi:predicted P-loop ATPase
MPDLLVTTWDGLSATGYEAEAFSIEQLGEIAKTERAPTKEQLRLITCGRFGSQRTAKGSYRSDDNMLAFTAVTGDVDGGTLSFQEAVTRLNARGLAFVAHTTGRHKPGVEERYRIYCPCSQELPLSEHSRMTDRLNGVLGGDLAGESWTVSQAWYIGQVDGIPRDFAVGLGEESIDEAEELDSIRRGKPGGGPGKPGKKGGKRNLKDLDEEELEAEFPKSRFHVSGRLLWLWALREISKADAQGNLEALFDTIPQTDRDARWQAYRNAIPQWVDKIYASAAKHLGTFLARMVVFFTEDPQFRGAIKLNEFTQTIEVPHPFPPKPGQIFTYRALREVDVLEALLIVQAKGFAKATISDVWRAVILTAEHQGYHPVREYLNGAEWDEKHRVNRLFIDYFPGELPPEEPSLLGQNKLSWRDKWVAYYEHTARCFMIGAVARIFEPGCKVDSLPIFVSKQRYYKGLGLQALIGNPAWFTDDIPVDVSDKDARDTLNGKWVAELSETPHLKKEVERFKSFVSRQSDRFRRPYERLTQDWPRQTVLTGTSNDLTYLDVTGNRRFWAIPLADRVNVELIKQNRDQLWAEAVHLYRDKATWWLSDELEDIAAEIQAGYVEDDVLERPIVDWLEKRRDARTKKVAPFEMSILLSALGGELGLGSRLTLGSGNAPTIASKTDQMRVANCLKRLGFHRSREYIGRTLRRVWIDQN